MSFKPVFYVIGILLLALSAMMLLPVLIDLVNNSPDWKVFAKTQIITAFVGFSLIFTNRQSHFHLTLRETFFLIGFAGIALAGFSALPFFFSEAHLPFRYAFFEAMAGITTTNATAFGNLDSLPQGILFWRASLQWLGGIGFLSIALAILPTLQASGMQIYKTRSSDIRNIMPDAPQMMAYIALIYTALTALCGGLLYFSGMSGFDALCHAMATISAGGFSTSSASIAHFNSSAIEIILTCFMLLSALPFLLYLRVMRGDFPALFADSQVRTFFGLFFLLALVMGLHLYYAEEEHFFDAVLDSAFTISSLLSTTGFANIDTASWSSLATGIAILAMLLGGCSDSASGGVKIFRLQILWLMLQQQLRKLIIPHGLFQVHYNGKVVESSVQSAIASFFFVFMISWTLVGTILQIEGLDFKEAYTSSIAMLSNVGTVSVGGKVPSGEAALWTLSAAMLFGRLEFLTLLVLFMPQFWQK